ncbi:phospholipase D family protein [Janthinobacterium sp. Mn2066]|uniref:phospholipase D family nuclease n=1 Tax=Janthinobacterium sp. Mn2066 TaxID=3395264 RepID=UPI003BDED20A
MPAWSAQAANAREVTTAIDAASIEHAFSPDDGAEALVLKVINTSVSSIRLAAYSFNSPAIVAALLDAKKRGVDIKVLVDAKRNQRSNSMAALNSLVQAGIPVRTIAVYAMHHDKYIVADQRTVQNGSFNYSRDAATSNSENVIVLWNQPTLAASFLQHWEDRWGKGVNYASR